MSTRSLGAATRRHFCVLDTVCRRPWSYLSTHPVCLHGNTSIEAMLSVQPGAVLHSLCRLEQTICIRGPFKGNTVARMVVPIFLTVPCQAISSLSLYLAISTSLQHLRNHIGPSHALFIGSQDREWCQLILIPPPLDYIASPFS